MSDPLSLFPTDPPQPDPAQPDPEALADQFASLLAASRPPTPAAPGPNPAAAGAVRPAPEPTLRARHLDPDLVPHHLLEGLNPNQRAAVQTLEGPLLVVAGPGSGKTRVLTHRIAALLAAGAPAWGILAVTFTNKAAAEMRERLATLVGDDAVRDMWVGTFHSVCVRLLRANHDAAGLPRSFTIMDASDSERVVRNVLATMGADPTEARSWHSRISYQKNHQRTPEDLAATRRPEDRALADVWARYDQRLADMGAVDFDDLLLRTLTLLEQHPDIADRYRRKFHHVLVDEYQDTNVVQYGILRVLASGWGNPCAVGDADQAIYSWRAASSEAAYAAWHRDHPHSQVVVLDQNYRSTKAILDAAQAVIDPNPADHRAQLWTDNADGDPVELVVCGDDRSEADVVLARLKASRGQWGRFAVLVRTNAQTRLFEEGLTRLRVPYTVVGALRFYDRAEVRDALAYLRFATNPRDAVSFARCANTPRRGLGDVAVTTATALAADHDGNILTALRAGLTDGTLPTRTHTAFRELVAAIDAIRHGAATGGPGAATRAAVHGTGLRAALATKEPDRVENLDELVSSAERFVGQGTSPTNPEIVDLAALPGDEQTLAFLEAVALISSADEDAGAQSVSLLTAHAAKGKEFDEVFVVGCEDGYYPHARVASDPAAVAEERRLLFVAMTRARERLTLTRAESRYSFGQVQDRSPSPFLADLPAAVEVRRQGPARATGLGQRPWGERTYRPHQRPATTTARPKRTTTPPEQHRRTPPTPPSTTRLTAEQVPAGTRVEHPSFGTGQVLAVNGDEVAIAFRDRRRTLLLAYAPLTLTD